MLDDDGDVVVVNTTTGSPRRDSDLRVANVSISMYGHDDDDDGDIS